MFLWSCTYILSISNIYVLYKSMLSRIGMRFCDDCTISCMCMCLSVTIYNGTRRCHHIAENLDQFPILLPSGLFRQTVCERLYRSFFFTSRSLSLSSFEWKKRTLEWETRAKIECTEIRYREKHLRGPIVTTSRVVLSALCLLYLGSPSL